MKNEYKHKTKEQLIKDLEVSKTQRKQVQKVLRENKKSERRFQERLINLLEVSSQLSIVDTFDDLCRRAVELGHSRLGFDRLGLWFIDDNSSIIVGSFAVDENGRLRDERCQRVGVSTESVMGKVITNKMLSINQVDTPLFNNRGEIIGRGEQAIAAIRDGEEVIGCISTDNFLLHQPIMEYQCELLTMYASSLGHLCLCKRAEEELKRSLERLRMALGGTINAIALTVEARDPYTAGHQRCVADLARIIATEMRLPKKQIDGIRMAGTIHDIGKMSIPYEILSKPSRLTEIEFSMIKTHSQKGFDILRTTEFPWPIAQIVLQHHERMNGSGYPSGLASENILLEARILGVADVVEAMASHRPYRPALGIDKALEEISQNRGILYDSKAVDTCLRVFTEKEFDFE